VRLNDSSTRVGYLPKDRVAHIDAFIATLDHLATVGSVVDAGLVAELLAALRGEDPLPLSRRANGRYSNSWPKVAQIAASPRRSRNPKDRSKRTYETSAQGSTSQPPRPKPSRPRRAQLPRCNFDRKPPSASLNP
jgi:hypothetical protein